MIALEIQKFDKEGETSFTGSVAPFFRALVWDLGDHPNDNKLLLQVVECDTAANAASFALELHPEVTHAKFGNDVQRADELSVSETARAMAGVW